MCWSLVLSWLLIADLSGTGMWLVTDQRRVAHLWAQPTAMYFVYGWPQSLRATADTIGVVANTDRSLFALLDPNQLSIWYFRPTVRIVSHKRDHKSVEEFGTNVRMVWRPDSTLIVVQTDKNFLLYYKVVINTKHDCLLQQKDVE